MSNQPEPTFKAASAPMGFGPPSMAVAAPIGAVGRKDRERASKTALHREGPSTFLLVTELPGSLMLQRRGADGTWETIDARTASNLGRTHIELPHDAASPPPTYRVVFSPKNPNLNPWVSDDVGN